MARQPVVVRALLLLGNVVGGLALFWPFVLGSRLDSIEVSRLVPYAWAIVLPILLVLLVQSLLAQDRDIRSLAMLAALAALAAAVRPLGAGVAGLEPIWAVILIGGRALGARLGYLLGAFSMAVSALLTGGVGPWLPYQMLVGAWVGAAPALLPTLRGRREVAFMTILGGITGLAVGALLNLWFWPLAIGIDPAIAFVPGLSASENLAHWLRYGLLTSAGFDVPRAALLASLLALSSTTLLGVLRRATRRASFAPVIATE